MSAIRNLLKYRFIYMYDDFLEYYSVALFHQILVIKPVTHRQVCVRKCEIQAGIYFCVWPFLSLRLPAHCYDYANAMRGQVNDYHIVRNRCKT